MSNQGPIPTMTTDVWNAIKNLDLAANGGWTIDTVEHFLYLIETNEFGASEWDLKPEADAPDGTFQAPMSSGDWADLKGGTLATEVNIIVVGGTAENRIQFTNVSGEAKAVRIDV